MSARLRRMRRLTVVILAMHGFGCMQEDPEIGSDFFDDVSFEIVAWDTLTMDMSTVYYDSVRTNSPGRLLVGQAEHKTLDLIETEFYIQFNSSLTYSTEDLKNSTFADASLTLYYDGYFYGDTTQLMDLSVYELAEELELDEDSRLYSNSSFEVKRNESGEPVVVGNHQFDPRPNGRDSIEIPLNETFAKPLFDYLSSDQVAVEDFLDSLQGLTIKSNATGSVIGFHTPVLFKLNYLDRSESPTVERTLQIWSDSTAIQFNHIEARSFDDLFSSEEDELPSTLIDNQAFIQAGMGLAIKVELPYLRQLLLTDDAPLIDEATLELVFSNEIPEEAHMLYSGVIVNKVNDKNEVQFTYETSADLMLDFEYDEDRKFVIDITDFVTEQLAVDLIRNEDALVIQFPGEYTTNTVNHLMVLDQDHTVERSRVIINLLNIK